MISVSEAYNIVLSQTTNYGIEEVDLKDAIGRVLASDVFADRPFPPFDRVTMDGIAISYDAYNNNKRTFQIESIAPAGSPQGTLQSNLKCIEVTTGAVLPFATDTVIRYEDLSIIEGSVTINSIVKQGQNVHNLGSDHGHDSVLLNEGHTIKAIDINVLATVGMNHITVIRRPTIAIISSGDELVSVDSIPLPHQIRMSNVHMIKARLTELDIVSDHFHIQDNEAEIQKTLTVLIEKYDVILMSGGVSKGKFDFIPDALTSIGVECLFHKVAQRPGKPLWFGRNEKVTVFAFPGNPVSTLACFHKYFVPWLSKAIGESYLSPSVIIRSDIAFKPNLTFFAQANIEFEQGKIYAKISKGNGSGDMVHTTMMDGFVELPKGKDVYKAGEVYSFIPFHSILK